MSAGAGEQPGACGLPGRGLSPQNALLGPPVDSVYLKKAMKSKSGHKNMADDNNYQ